MLDLAVATVLLQWAAGGLAFGWVTTRRRVVGLGYGWLIRITFGVMAAVAAAVGFAFDPHPVRDGAAVAAAAAAVVALGVSVARRRAGVSGERAQQYRRSARVAAMTGIERRIDDGPERMSPSGGAEFDPRLDLVAPAVALVGLVAAGAGGDPAWLAVARLVVGAAFLGAVTDAMLLGHWYLVQPGLSRAPLGELVRATLWTWPVQVAVLLIPPGMVSVFTGTIDDGWDGVLGWFWLACAVATGVLGFVTRAALRERQYSAVMAATGLLYLAILTAFGTTLVAEALLVPG